MGGRQTEVDGPRSGFTVLKAGAGFGVWDNSALGLERESEVEYSRVHLEVVTHWGEKSRSISRVVSPTLFFLKLSN